MKKIWNFLTKSIGTLVILGTFVTFILFMINEFTKVMHNYASNDDYNFINNTD